jgi:hypothetical protein
MLLAATSCLERFSAGLSGLAGISEWLKKERGLSFHGGVDFISTEEYMKKDAAKAIRGVCRP